MSELDDLQAELEITRKMLRDVSRVHRQFGYGAFSGIVNQHKTMVHNKCPNGCWDYFTVEVATDKMIWAEDIEKAADTVRGGTRTQEQLAKAVHGELKAFDPDVTIVVTGQHGQNVRSVVTVGR